MQDFRAKSKNTSIHTFAMKLDERFTKVAQAFRFFDLEGKGKVSFEDFKQCCFRIQADLDEQ